MMVEILLKLIIAFLIFSYEGTSLKSPTRITFDCWAVVVLLNDWTYFGS